ncbi:hypothetical protein GCM10023191_074320 [Actinoallomurus oryzae]|uniref:Uncharacterized protein n=1 Tax=Actinoallomurus oryzae TaxID=502180 RepID=A0ABP8QV80_9ACTN
MEILSYPNSRELCLVATAAELTRLAAAVAAGEGSFACSPTSPEGRAVTAVRVVGTAGPGVRVDVSQSTLLIDGDAEARAVLADNLRDMAAMEDGGHLHVDHFPGHPYLAAGSVPLVVESPHGGMPRP